MRQLEAEHRQKELTRHELVIHYLNKTGTSKVGAISKAQKAQSF